jgi:hypothetical protein
VFTRPACRARPAAAAAPCRPNDYRHKLLAASLLVSASAGKEPRLWQEPGYDAVATDEY